MTRFVGCTSSTVLSVWWCLFYSSVPAFSWADIAARSHERSKTPLSGTYHWHTVSPSEALYCQIMSPTDATLLSCRVINSKPTPLLSCRIQTYMKRYCHILLITGFPIISYCLTNTDTSLPFNFEEIYSESSSKGHSRTNIKQQYQYNCSDTITPNQQNTPT